MTEATGRVVQILGGVVDARFPADDMPQVYDAVEIQADGKGVILEIQNHLGKGMVRGVAMDATEGLRRGMSVLNTERPITVPVGEATLGRMFDVLGHPIDGLGEVEADTEYAIHRDAPSRLHADEVRPTRLEFPPARAATGHPG